jgi:hypothetical protein
MEPIEDELRFIQNVRSQCVHVVLPSALVEDDGPAAKMSTEEFAAGLLEAWARRTPVVCGRALHTSSIIHMAQDPNFAEYRWVRAFRDEDLCWGCHRGLGDQAALAFQHPLPGQEDDG